MSAITKQPGGELDTDGISLDSDDGSKLRGHMERPAPVMGCPPGLEYLAAIDQLILKQTVHMVEVFCPWEKNNHFIVYNNMGQQVFTTQEETSCAMRYFCGSGRGFVYKIVDNTNTEVLIFERKFKCCAGCCWCADSDGCAFVLHVKTPQGELLGTVRQMKSGWKPYLQVSRDDGDVIGTIAGPCCPCNCGPCTGDVEFPLMPGARDRMGDVPIAKISKEWTGAAREIFTDADTYSCTFPLDMDVRSKAVVFGATLLVDMMFFQKGDN